MGERRSNRLKSIPNYNDAIESDEADSDDYQGTQRHKDLSSDEEAGEHVARTTARRVTKTVKRARGGAKKASKPARAPQPAPASLMAIVNGRPAVMVSVAKRWAEQHFRGQQNDGPMQLVRFILDLAGGTAIALTPRDFQHSDIGEWIDDNVLTMGAAKSPLLIGNRASKALASVAAVLEPVVDAMPLNMFTGVDPVAVTTLIDWITPLTRTKARNVRVAASVVGLRLWAEYVRRFADDDEFANSAGPVRVAIDEMFADIFKERYRDVQPIVRRAAVEALGDVLVTMAHLEGERPLMGNEHTKYLGWELSDTDDNVRAAAFNALGALVAVPGAVQGETTIVSFLRYFADRIVQATADKETNIDALTSVASTIDGDEERQDILSDTHHALIGEKLLVFTTDTDEVSAAAAEFVSKTVFGTMTRAAIKEARTARDADEVDPTRIALETFIKWLDTTGLTTPSAVLVAAFAMTPRQKELQAWATLVDLAQMEDSPAVRLLLHGAQYATGVPMTAPETYAALTAKKLAGLKHTPVTNPVTPSPDGLAEALLDGDALKRTIDRHTGKAQELPATLLLPTIARHLTLADMDRYGPTIKTVVTHAAREFERAADGPVCHAIAAALTALSEDDLPIGPIAGGVLESLAPTPAQLKPRGGTGSTQAAPAWERAGAVARHHPDVITDDILDLAIETLHDSTTDSTLIASVAGAIASYCYGHLTTYHTGWPRAVDLLKAGIVAAHRVAVPDTAAASSMPAFLTMDASLMMAVAAVGVTDELWRTSLYTGLADPVPGDDRRNYARTLVHSAEETLELLEDELEDAPDSAKTPIEGRKSELVGKLMVAMAGLPPLMRFVHRILTRWEQHGDKIATDIAELFDLLVLRSPDLPRDSDGAVMTLDRMALKALQRLHASLQELAEEEGGAGMNQDYLAHIKTLAGRLADGLVDEPELPRLIISIIHYVSTHPADVCLVMAAVRLMEPCRETHEDPAKEGWEDWAPVVEAIEAAKETGECRTVMAKMLAVAKAWRRTGNEPSHEIKMLIQAVSRESMKSAGVGAARDDEEEEDVDMEEDVSDAETASLGDEDVDMDGETQQLVGSPRSATMTVGGEAVMRR